MYKPTYNENDRGCRLLWKACSSKWAGLIFLLLLLLLALLLLLLLLFYFLNQGKPSGVAKITKHAQNVWQCTLRWPLVTNTAVVQRDNWILVTKRICSNIPVRLNQSPVQTAQELKRIPVDWPCECTVIGTNAPCDESPTYSIITVVFVVIIVTDVVVFFLFLHLRLPPLLLF